MRARRKDSAPHVRRLLAPRGSSGHRRAARALVGEEAPAQVEGAPHRKDHRPPLRRPARPARARPQDRGERPRRLVPVLRRQQHRRTPRHGRRALPAAQRPRPGGLAAQPSARTTPAAPQGDLPRPLDQAPRPDQPRDTPARLGLEPRPRQAAASRRPRRYPRRHQHRSTRPDRPRRPRTTRRGRRPQPPAHRPAAQERQEVARRVPHAACASPT